MMKQLVCVAMLATGCMAADDATNDQPTATATDASFAYSPMGFARVTAAGSILFDLVDSSTVALHRFSSPPGVVASTRTGVGLYNVTFGGLAPSASGTGQGGNVQVAAEGPGNVRCRIASWDFTAVNISVRCELPNGTAADSPFAVLFTRQAMPALNSQPTRFAYAWVDTLGRTPLTYNYNSSGQANTATRVNGRTVVHIPGVTVINASVMVSPYSGTAVCGVYSWVFSPSGGADVTVDCRNAGNTQVFSAFTLSFANSGPAPEQQGGHTYFNSTSSVPGLTHATPKVSGCSFASVSASRVGSLATVVVSGTIGPWDATPFVRASFASGFDVGSYCKVESLDVTSSGSTSTATTTIRCYDATGAVNPTPWFPFTHITSDASGPC